MQINRCLLNKSVPHSLLNAKIFLRPQYFIVSILFLAILSNLPRIKPCPLAPNPRLQSAHATYRHNKTLVFSKVATRIA